MKLSWFSIVIATLLVCAVGCAKQHEGSYTFTFGFNVDGRYYGCSGAVQINPNGTVGGSAIVVYPADQDSPVSKVLVGVLYDPPGVSDRLYLAIGGEEIEANVPGYFAVYYFDGDKIHFPISYRELGIDARDYKNSLSEKNLVPILEKLIREHIKPQKEKE